MDDIGIGAGQRVFDDAPAGQCVDDGGHIVVTIGPVVTGLATGDPSPVMRCTPAMKVSVGSVISVPATASE